MQVGSLGWEEPLEEEATTHSSVLARKITWTGAWGAAVLGAAQSRALSTAHSQEERTQKQRQHNRWSHEVEAAGLGS